MERSLLETCFSRKLAFARLVKYLCIRTETCHDYSIGLNATR